MLSWDFMDGERWGMGALLGMFLSTGEIGVDFLGIMGRWLSLVLFQDGLDILLGTVSICRSKRKSSRKISDEMSDRPENTRLISWYTTMQCNPTSIDPCVMSSCRETFQPPPPPFQSSKNYHVQTNSPPHS